jgi:CHRD domain
MKARILMGAAALALAISPLSMQAAQAKVTQFRTVLSGAHETPPHPGAGKGFGMIMYDDKTHELRWKISFSGLSGVATMAHFHGPAKPGVAAGVEVALGSGPLVSPLIGSATLTDQQAKDLLAGLFYVNIHTAANPKGEIRGQVVKSGHSATMMGMSAKPMMNNMNGSMGDMKGMPMGDMKGMQMASPPKQ